MPIEPADKHASHSATWPLFSDQYLIFCICGSEAGEINGGKSCRRKIFYILFFFFCLHLIYYSTHFYPMMMSTIIWSSILVPYILWSKVKSACQYFFSSSWIKTVLQYIFHTVLYICVGTSWDWNKPIWCKDVEQKVLETLSSSIMNSTFILYNEVNFHYRDATKWWWML